MIIINNIGHGVNSQLIAVLAAAIYLMIIGFVIPFIFDRDYIPRCIDEEYIIFPIIIFITLVIPLTIMAIILK